MTDLSKLKVCIISDWLTEPGGAEKVVSAMSSVFESAPIHIAVADIKGVNYLFNNDQKIKTSYLQWIPNAHVIRQYLLPFLCHAIRSFDLSQYDVVLSSSSCVAKNVRVTKDQLHICYIHTPVRYAWEANHDPRFQNLPSIIQWPAKLYLNYFKNRDYKYRNNVQHYISNSRATAERVEKYYGRQSEVLYPPVDFEHLAIDADQQLNRHLTSANETQGNDTKQMTLINNGQPFFLGLGRLVPYKRADLLVEAFIGLPEHHLIIAGGGSEQEALEQRVRESGATNIELLGHVPTQLRNELLNKAQAMVLPQREDAGIVQLEALASGTPVIAFGEGGALDVIDDGITGLFFKEQTPESIQQAVTQFHEEKEGFEPEALRESVRRYSKESFANNYFKLVQEKVSEHFTT